MSELELDLPMFDEESEDGKTLCRYPDYSEDPDFTSKAEYKGDVPSRGENAEGIEREVWDALYGVEDPEMPISIVDLGLIYDVNIGEEGGNTVASIDMTLTYTGCPARNMLMYEIEESVKGVEGIDEVDLSLVYSPGWNVGMVSEEGKQNLREFGLSI